MAIPTPRGPVTATLPPGAGAIPLSGADVSPLGSADPVNLPPRPAFVLIHHANAYEHVQVDGRWVIVPRLDRFDLVPGVNHIEAAQQGRPNADRTSAAFSELRRQGAIILAADQHPVTDAAHLPAGVAPGRYSRMLQVRDSRSGLDGQHWHEVWEIHSLGRAGMSKTYDKAAYARWRLWLMESGAIEKPPADIAATIIGDAETRLARIKGDAYLSPDQRAERSERAAAELTALQRDLSDAPPVPPAPSAAPVPPPRPTRARAQGQTPELPPAPALGAAEEGT